MLIESTAAALPAGEKQTDATHEEHPEEGMRLQDAENQNVYVLSISDCREVADGTIEDSIVFEIADRDKAEICLLQRVILDVTGKKMRFYLPERFISLAGAKAAAQTDDADTETDKIAGHIVPADKCISCFAEMQVRMADGRSTLACLDMCVSPELEQYFAWQATGEKDTLQVRLAVSADGLDKETLCFDLDKDGKRENISYLKNGSGFLLLDKNTYGEKNEESALFGASKGNGFMELAPYDMDGQAWMEEDDPVYDKLRIWTKDENGRDQLFAIGQQGIGAIFVRGVKSAYGGHNGVAQVRRKHIFLHKSGIV